MGASLRHAYQWRPAKFLVGADGPVTIAGDVHNVPPAPRWDPLRRAIAGVFEAMLLRWRALKVVPPAGLSGEPTRLQVIVKAQRYNIDAVGGMEYKGRWHVEGTSRERIVAAGSYYAEVDSRLEGGGLVFRSGGEAPSVHYRRAGLELTAEVPVAAGTAVAWSNDCPHRFRALRAGGAGGGEAGDGGGAGVACRTFLTFFVVDPARPIAGADVLDANNRRDVARRRLAAVFFDQRGWRCARAAPGARRWGGRRVYLPPSVARLLASFVPCRGQWGSAAEEFAWRDRMRLAMTRAPGGGFAEISCWGNLGNVRWCGRVKEAVALQDRAGAGRSRSGG